MVNLFISKILSTILYLSSVIVFCFGLWAASSFESIEVFGVQLLENAIFIQIGIVVVSIIASVVLLAIAHILNDLADLRRRFLDL